MLPLSNRLKDTTSPYLLQHKDNPVHWQPWGAEAFAAARQLHRPILLSVGYAACHWCHVMAHESFEDADIARLMNELYINIKLDREERPDLDAIYQSALALLGQAGGWPLTMFLTSAGHPFWGGTYFPPNARWGRPGFPDVLKSIAEIHAREPDKVATNVEALRQAMAPLALSRGGGPLGPEALARAAASLFGEVDPVHGGIGEAPKFPQCAIFELLWRQARRNGDPRYRQAALMTARHMCQGGIYDHLRGGFARYTVDRHWLAPHFEKMLYDNAALIEHLCLLWQDTREPLFAARVGETISWLLADMRADPGSNGRRGFASSLDADSEGEEGKYYVWSAGEIDRALGPDAPTFKAFYGATPEGNWEGHNILNRLHAADDSGDETWLGPARATLLARRALRVAPGRDDKVLADWNGMIVAALATAAAVFERADWLGPAEEAFAFVAADMAEGDRLYHAWRRGRRAHPAVLEDYAQMCRAALVLHEVTAKPHYLAQTESWLAAVERHYADPAGGYFTAADDTRDVILRLKTAADNPTPSGNAVLLGVFARLYYLTGQAAWRDKAEALVAAFSGELARNVFPLASFLNNVELLGDAVQVVVVGEPNAADTRALVRAVHGAATPTRVLSVLPPGGALPAAHPAHGKTDIADGAVAYVCRGQACSLPITAPDALARALAPA